MQDPMDLQRGHELISLSATLDLGASYGLWIGNGDRISCV